MMGERDGSVAVITALLLPVLVGFFALALEPAFWMQVQRSAQNAADSAVLAAATNGGAHGIRTNGAPKAKLAGCILAHGLCAQAGLAMPAGQVPGRGKLVT